MSSTQNQPPRLPVWRLQGLRYYSLKCFHTLRYGRPLAKISLDAGLGCPNRDPATGSGGCIYCDPASFSPSRRNTWRPIAQQLAEGIERLGRRRPAIIRPLSPRERVRVRASDEKGTLPLHVIAYFQPGTNTFGPIDHLRTLFVEAVADPRVVGLAVGTRPDCLADEALDLLVELAQRCDVTVELGLQSACDATLAAIRRGHDAATFFQAVDRCAQRGLPVVAHVILGLPGEGPEQFATTARALAASDIAGVKIHNLHVVAGTPLSDMLHCGECSVPTLEQYAGWTADFLELLRPTSVIHRLIGDAPREYLLAPEWCLNKQAALAAIHAELERRDTWQGRQ